MSTAEIALISPTVELAIKARKIIEKRNENIDVFVSDKEDAIGDALKIARYLASKCIW